MSNIIMTAQEAKNKSLMVQQNLYKTQMNKIIQAINEAIDEGHTECYLVLDTEDLHSNNKNKLENLGYKVAINRDGDIITISW